MFITAGSLMTELPMSKNGPNSDCNGFSVFLTIWPTCAFLPWLQISKLSILTIGKHLPEMHFYRYWKTSGYSSKVRTDFTGLTLGPSGPRQACPKALRASLMTEISSRNHTFMTCMIIWSDDIIRRRIWSPDMHLTPPWNYIRCPNHARCHTTI